LRDPEESVIVAQTSVYLLSIEEKVDMAGAGSLVGDKVALRGYVPVVVLRKLAPGLSSLSDRSVKVLVRMAEDFGGVKC